MRSLLPALGSLLFTIVPAAADIYVNPRFGTTAEFPSEVFDQPQPPPANGDGQRWLSSDGAELAVFASFNVLEQQPTAYFDELIADRKQTTTLTYSRATARWAVVSGFSGNNIYYEKYLFGAGDEIVHAMIIRYPVAAKSRFDPLVGPIANSLGGP